MYTILKQWNERKMKSMIIIKTMRMMKTLRMVKLEVNEELKTMTKRTVTVTRSKLALHYGRKWKKTQTK